MKRLDVAGPSDVVSDAQHLLALYADMNRTLLDADPGSDTVAAATRLAVKVIPGVEQASITEGHNGRFRTVASTGDIATLADKIQYELGTGPCVDVIVDDIFYLSNDIAHDSRWSEFGTRAHAETGATSMMSLRLFIEGRDRIAGLNLYSTAANAFDDGAHVVAKLVATHSATALGAASGRERVEDLQQALTASRLVGIAVGVLMVSHTLTEDDAFALLRIASQHRHRQLVEIADDVIATGIVELPAPESVTAVPRSDPSRPSRPSGPALNWFSSQQRFWADHRTEP